MTADYSKNLRLLCAEKTSIAHVCREIGIKQQQFSRYLSGVSVPSAHNQRRICLYFGVSNEKMHGLHDDLKSDRDNINHFIGSTHQDPFEEAFPGDIRKMRQYLGVYHNYCISPSWGEKNVLVGASFLYEHNRQILSRTIERGQLQISGQDKFQRSRYDGKAGYHGSRIFIIEFEREHDACIVETVLFPAHRQQKKYLRGLTLGIAWRPRRMPYSSRSIWKKLDSHLHVRDILRGCGVFPMNSSNIDPNIRNFLNKTVDFAGSKHGLK